VVGLPGPFQMQSKLQGRPVCRSERFGCAQGPEAGEAQPAFHFGLKARPRQLFSVAVRAHLAHLVDDHVDSGQAHQRDPFVGRVEGRRWQRQDGEQRHRR
jgi:hypothetical protein